MKNSLTFLFLWLSIVLTAQSNLGIIKVNVENGCGNDAFDKPVTIDLYQFTNNDAIKIASSNTHPAVFSNLATDKMYEVRISSSDMQQTDLTVRDAFAGREAILGLHGNFYNLATAMAGDVNDSESFTTLDLVIMLRHMIKIKHLPLEGWFFVDQAHLFNNVAGFLKYYNKTTFDTIPNGIKEITFKAYKQGAVASTLAPYCAVCSEDSTSAATIQMQDMNVIAGTEVEFVINFSGRGNDAGSQFTLRYNDAVISKVTPSNVSLTNQVDSISSIHFVTVFNPMSSAFSEIAKIKFMPLRSGKLASFFAFNEDFKKEFVYKADNCLKTYQNVVLKTTGPCPVTWPVDTTIPDCLVDYNTGSPVIDPACILTVTVAYSDQVFGNPCNKILRTWTAINWLTMEIFTHTQVITVDGNYSTVCQDVTVVVTDSLVIYAKDLIKNNVIGHVYSFSANDPNQNKLTLKYESPYVVDLTVYDLTENRFCISRVTKVNTGCNEPVKVIREISLEGTNGFYLAKGILFDAGNEDQCLGTISDFQIRLLPSGSFAGQLIFDFDQYKGTNLMVELRCKINGNWVNQGLVKIIFLSGSELPPFELTCYDDPVTKNELFEIAFFSPTFDNVLALQGAIRVKDAIVVNTKKKKLSDIVFNEELRSLKYLWLLPTVTSQSFSEHDTLFTMTILPTVSGNLSDILSTAEDLLNSEAILNDFEQTKIDLVFKFLRRSSSTKDLVQNDITVYPNPTGTGTFTIQSDAYQDASISIYNDNGQMIYETKIKGTSDGLTQVSMPENSKNGIYILRLMNDKYISTKRIILVNQNN